MLTYDTQPTPGKEIRVALGHAPIHHKPPMPPPPPPQRYIIHPLHSSLSHSPGCSKSYIYTLQYSARIRHPSCPGVVSSSPGSPVSDPPFTWRVPVSFIPHLTRLPPQHLFLFPEADTHSQRVTTSSPVATL